MLKSQVAAGMASRGIVVAIVKLIYKMRSILSAEKPCNAEMKISEKERSKVSRDLSLFSADTLVFNNFAEPLACGAADPRTSQCFITPPCKRV